MSEEKEKSIGDELSEPVIIKDRSDTEWEVSISNQDIILSLKGEEPLVTFTPATFDIYYTLRELIQMSETEEMFYTIEHDFSQSNSNFPPIIISYN